MFVGIKRIDFTRKQPTAGRQRNEEALLSITCRGKTSSSSARRNRQRLVEREERATLSTITVEDAIGNTMSYTIAPQCFLLRPALGRASHIIGEKGDRRNRRHNADSSISTKASPSCRRPTSCCSCTLCAKKMSLFNVFLRTGKAHHRHCDDASCAQRKRKPYSVCCTGGWSTRAGLLVNQASAPATPSGGGNEAVS